MTSNHESFDFQKQLSEWDSRNQYWIQCAAEEIADFSANGRRLLYHEVEKIITKHFGRRPRG